MVVGARHTALNGLEGSDKARRGTRGQTARIRNKKQEMAKLQC